MIEKLKGFIRLAYIAERIAESEAGWKTKYELIFSPEISGRLRELFYFTWCDPDMGYDDDVLAFIDALKDKREELELVLKSLEE